MSLFVKTITRLSTGLIFIYGVYIALSGQSGPGGGFAGGIILALCLIQLMLAFGKAAVIKMISPEKGLIIASGAALVFLFAVSASGRKLLPVGIAEIASSTMVGFSLWVIFLSLVLLISTRHSER